MDHLRLCTCSSRAPRIRRVHSCSRSEACLIRGSGSPLTLSGPCTVACVPLAATAVSTGSETMASVTTVVPAPVDPVVLVDCACCSCHVHLRLCSRPAEGLQREQHASKPGPVERGQPAVPQGSMEVEPAITEPRLSAVRAGSCHIRRWSF